MPGRICIMLLLFFPLLFHGKKKAGEKTHLLKPQLEVITKLVDSERDPVVRSAIISMLNYIDTVYVPISKQLRQKRKLVIFLDPAHGRLPDGRWEGTSVYKLGCDNRPEELYAIPLARAFYRKLAGDKRFKIKTTADFLPVLQGKSENYKNIYFKETVVRAKKASAFMIIASHLNNVAVEKKRDANCNVPGLHKSYSMDGERILTYVWGQHEGYLNVYNEMDASGFSRAYSENIIKRLKNKNVKINRWEKGSVGYNKLTSFVDFPMGIIFESGFISHPKESKLLRTDQYIDTIASAQYQALLDTLATLPGWSKSKEGMTQRKYNNMLRALKLGRAATICIKHRRLNQASALLREIQKHYSVRYRRAVRPLLTIIKKLRSAEKIYARAVNWYQQGKYTKAYETMLKAKNKLWKSALLYGYKDIYEKAMKIITRNISPIVQLKEKHYRVITADTPIILAIDRDRKLKKALQKAFGSGKSVLNAVYRSLRKAYVYKKAKRYDEKTKRIVHYWKKTGKKARFYPGIYIFQLAAGYRVKNLRRVRYAILDPKRYQNQQYLKNSWYKRR